MIEVCIAGVTGWTGRALAEGVLAADDLELRSGVARSAAGEEVGGAPVFARVDDALDGVDVLIDYTSHHVVKANALAAIGRGVAVVIGTSGLTAADFEEIDAAARAREHRRGVVGQLLADRRDDAGGRAARRAAPPAPRDHRLRRRDEGRRPERDRAGAGGAARFRARSPGSLDDTAGPIEARGATVGGVQVHSLRLPSFVVSTEVVFGLPDERLTIRHDAGGTPAPYVAGTLLAVRAVRGRVGLTRGLDQLLLS